MIFSSPDNYFILKNNGDMKFDRIPYDHRFGFNPISNTPIAVADFNQDGNDDFIHSNMLSLRMLWGDGNRTRDWEAARAKLIKAEQSGFNDQILG
ncbi:hypothetical protein GF373_05395 [bacterium]|nr:hypothetical protein [bacterium]